MFHVFVDHSYMLFGNTSIQILHPLLNTDLLLIVELQKFFICSRCKFLISYMISIYFWCWLFTFVMVLRQKVLILMKSNFSMFSCRLCFDVVPKTTLPNPRSWRFILNFLWVKKKIYFTTYPYFIYKLQVFLWYIKCFL